MAIRIKVRLSALASRKIGRAQTNATILNAGLLAGYNNYKQVKLTFKMYDLLDLAGFKNL